MAGTWWRRAAIAGVGLALAVAVIASTAAVLAREPARPAVHRSTQEAGPRIQPDHRDTPITMFGPSTDSGGLAMFGCLGTVSHASIDNNFARLKDRARRECGVRTGPRS